MARRRRRPKNIGIDKFVGNASHKAVEDRLRDLEQIFSTTQLWLGQQHAYLDAVKVLRSKQHTIDAKRMGDYLACSAPLHVVDGWNYLAQAFCSVLRGDRFIAYHLAYYAELRAAMAILATEGIGIFDHRHVSISSGSNVLQYHGGTHDVTWKVFREWFTSSNRSVELLSSVEVESRSLSDWLQMLGITPPSQQKAIAELLDIWSLDLKIVSEDRFRRNAMSYRPTRIGSPPPPSFSPSEELLAPLLSCWSSLEPFENVAKAAVDVILLRRGIMYAIANGIGNRGTFELALSDLEQHMSDDVLLLLESGDGEIDAVFNWAAQNPDPFVDCRSILCRALLLLRLASARCAQMLDVAGIGAEELRFWWNPLGTDLGWWDSESAVEYLVDLWDEVSGQVGKVRALKRHYSAGSPRVIYGATADGVALTQFSRAAMWLFGYGGYEVQLSA